MIDRFGTSGGALHRKLRAGEGARRARHARPQFGIAQHSRERPRPRVRFERRHEQSSLACVDELRIAAGGRRDHRHAERHRFEQRLGQPLDSRGQGGDRREAVEREGALAERHVHNAMSRRHPRLGGGELAIRTDPHKRQRDRPFESRERAQQDLLILATRDHDDDRFAVNALQCGSSRFELTWLRLRIDAFQIDAVRDHAQAARGMQPVAQRAGDRGAHGDRPVGREPDRDELRGRSQRHRAAGDDERLRQPAPPAQPRARTTIARRMTVHDVDAVVADHAGDCVCSATKTIEVEWHMRERRSGHDHP